MLNHSDGANAASSTAAQAAVLTERRFGFGRLSLKSAADRRHSSGSKSGRKSLTGKPQAAAVYFCLFKQRTKQRN